MASNYPASLDTTATLPAVGGVGANLSAFPHDALHGNADDAIIAVETELGTAPSGSFSTVKARFDALDTAFNGRVISHTRKTSDQATISAIVAVISPSACTHTANRRYLFTVSLLIAATAASNEFAVYLRNVGDGLTYRRWSWDSAGTLTSTFHGEHYTESSISGSQTWRIDVERLSGAGTATVYGSSITPNATPGSAPRFSTLTIEDVGSV